ncbi:MAG: hypothetical protein LAT57_05350 [Balneolales bacterium]|nr:hypothetical protein [Balneolales bacterium]
MAKTLGLFAGFGVELEYMIVDFDTLKVAPVAELLLRDDAGQIQSEVELGDIARCNELVSHVIELKTNGPAGQLSGLAEKFQSQVREINQILKPHNLCLLPSAMHPTMDPYKEMKLWPHEYSEIYETYNKIFDCRGHGWANLQSTHLNLPFSNDDEFGRLHAAIRAILPVLPVLAASSPIIDSKRTGVADNRLAVYKTNSRKVPSVSGSVIPEPVFTHLDYLSKLLQPIYDDIAPLDPDGILQFEWLNSRGAIARFDRNAIEIRVLDIQECPAADIAILELIVSVISHFSSQSHHNLRALSTQSLSHIFDEVIFSGSRAVISDVTYLQALGFTHKDHVTGRELWRWLLDISLKSVHPPSESSLQILNIILNEGNLSERIVKALGNEDGLEHISTVYKRLRDCLNDGTMFQP